MVYDSVSKTSCKYFTHYWLIDNKSYAFTYLICSICNFFIKFEQFLLIAYLKLKLIISIPLIPAGFVIGFKKIYF